MNGVRFTGGLFLGLGIVLIVFYLVDAIRYLVREGVPPDFPFLAAIVFSVGIGLLFGSKDRQ